MMVQHKVVVMVYHTEPVAMKLVHHMVPLLLFIRNSHMVVLILDMRINIKELLMFKVLLLVVLQVSQQNIIDVIIDIIAIMLPKQQLLALIKHKQYPSKFI
jgi:hypothetical protein